MMGMFSEIAIEGTIVVVVEQIKRDLEENKNKPEVCEALKKLGRFCLTQFEWSYPDWAHEYRVLFAETSIDFPAGTGKTELHSHYLKQNKKNARKRRNG